MRVLVTGAAGSIGQVLTSGLVTLGHEVVGLDLVRPPEGVDAEWHLADCTDSGAVAEVFAAGHLDAVVHLAGVPDEGSLPEELTSHVVSTAAVLDAMVEHRVTRIVHASSNHAVGRVPRRDLLTTDVRPRADTYYGVAKVAAEALLQLFADRHGLDAVTCRIGSFLEQPETRRHLSTWLSPGDCVRMVHAGLTATAPGFVVIHGISANTRAWWDLEPGRRLGYDPVDDAEQWAGSIADRPQDEDEAAYVGGPFALREVHRPALGD